MCGSPAPPPLPWLHGTQRGSRGRSPGPGTCSCGPVPTAPLRSGCCPYAPLSEPRLLQNLPATLHLDIFKGSSLLLSKCVTIKKGKRRPHHTPSGFSRKSGLCRSRCPQGHGEPPTPTPTPPAGTGQTLAPQPLVPASLPATESDTALHGAHTGQQFGVTHVDAPALTSSPETRSKNASCKSPPYELSFRHEPSSHFQVTAGGAEQKHRAGALAAHSMVHVRSAARPPSGPSEGRRAGHCLGPVSILCSTGHDGILRF